MPEFPLSVRSQLLVGPESYALEHNPVYEEAFFKLDDYTFDEELLKM